MNDLTVIYLTANIISDKFAFNMRNNLRYWMKEAGLSEDNIISISKKPINFGRNVLSDCERSHVGIYHDALKGVKEAKTKYIMIAEDDILYSPEHFKKRPTRDDIFAYNTACWSVFTWSNPPLYSYSERRNHGLLICTRDVYIEAMEERFAKFPDDSQINIANWSEPGKYERNLGVTVRNTEFFYTDPACVMFTHPEGLSMNGLGMRKRLAPIRAVEIPYWGRAEEVLKLYSQECLCGCHNGFDIHDPKNCLCNQHEKL